MLNGNAPSQKLSPACMLYPTVLVMLIPYMYQDYIHVYLLGIA